jgi:hypothetical protein
MATTCFCEEVIQDKKESDGRMRLEFGRSSFYGGESLVYLTVDDKTLIIDEATGRKSATPCGSLALISDTTSDQMIDLMTDELIDELRERLRRAEKVGDWVDAAHDGPA